jgi:hypothetical protein
MTFAQLFITPLGPLGEALSKFFAGLMLHVPKVLLPFIIGIVLLIIIILIFAYFGFKLRLWTWIGSFELTSQTAVTTTTNNLEQLVNQLKTDITNIKSENRELRLQLEHNSTSSLQKSSSLSNIRRIKPKRKRLSFNQQSEISSNEADNEQE